MLTSKGGPYSVWIQDETGTVYDGDLNIIMKGHLSDEIKILTVNLHIIPATWEQSR
jgi:hypothetical protein